MKTKAGFSGLQMVLISLDTEYIPITHTSEKALLRKLSKKYKNENIRIPEINNSIQSWIGHVKHADSFQLRKEIFRNTVFTKTLN